MLQAALDYAKRGWPVFPIQPGGKAPLTEHGYKDATTFLDQIRIWWTRWPMANIGFAITTGLLVIDVDPRNGGVTPTDLPETLTALTGGGGEHYYFRIPNDTRLSKTLSTGVDLKTSSGYVLLPPSFTSGPYKWINDTAPILDIPAEILKQATKPEVIYTEHEAEYDDPTDTRPGTLYNRNTTWQQLLEPLGWKIVGQNGDELFWCRPGKSSGISATTNYQGTNLLYVFTSSTALEPERGYTKFAALASLSYEGDFSLCASVLLQDSGQQYTSSSVMLGVPKISEPVTKKEYKFEQAFAPDHFVSKFTAYVSKQTDAPLEYAEASALSLLSLAGYKCKSALAPYPGGLSNNLYICLVGPTTRSRKSTVQRIAGDIIKQVMPPSLLPNRATTEALIKALANRNGVPSIWTPDEFGVTLAEIYNRDFMKGLEEMLLTVYSGDDYEYQRVVDSIVIRSPHLSVLGAATPDSIARAGTTALDSGLLPRFAIVYPEVMPNAIPVSDAPDLRVERSYLIQYLNQIVEWSNHQANISFSGEALTLLNNAEAELTSSPAARLPTMLYKVAALSAIGAKHAEVAVSDAESAITVVNKWAKGMATLIPQMYRHGADQQFEQQLDYVLGAVESAGGAEMRMTLANLINVKKQRLDELESTLVDKGRIRVEVGQGGKKWILL